MLEKNKIFFKKKFLKKKKKKKELNFYFLFHYHFNIFLYNKKNSYFKR